MSAATRQFAFRVSVLAAFALACLAFAAFFWTRAGGVHVAGFDVGSYRLEMRTDDVDGLISDSEVRVAGIEVGRVVALDPPEPGGTARVVMAIDEDVAPLHEGATARIAMKSLVGATFVDLVDGPGPALPSGATFTGDAVLPSVEVQDVVRGLDPPTREALGATVRSLGTATDGTGTDVGRLVSGVGVLGREGRTALDAIAAQSQDLEALTVAGTTLLDALHAGNGDIARVVEQSQRIASATAGQRTALADAVRELPGVVESAGTASRDLEVLSGSLAPVASDLAAAAPALDAALRALPETTRDLRAVLAPLDGVLERAPATLTRAPRLGDDVRDLVPPTRDLLADAQPMLRYASPYGRDIGAMLANFGSSMQTNVENGVNPLRLGPIVNSQGFRSYPVPTDGLDPTNWNNPYPTPGRAGSQAPFVGDYPRVERAPR